MITQEQLKNLLNYCPETGQFTWIKPTSSKVKVGSIAGSPQSGGYIQIRINNKRYMAHRLAYLYIYSVWPKEFIDHINGIKTDNRICNLRDATNQQNQRNRGAQSNNTSGYKGVVAQGDKWRAQIIIDGKYKSLGLYYSKSEASYIYILASIKYFGEFVRL